VVAQVSRNLPQDADDASITEASISLSHKLGLVVLAEGVESREQDAYLRAHDCDLIQDFYLSQPLPAERAIPFMSDAQAEDRPLS